MKLAKHTFISLFASFFIAVGYCAAAETVRVLVWDEQQPEQKQGYGEKFLGETLAAHLAKLPGVLYYRKTA